MGLAKIQIKDIFVFYFFLQNTFYHTFLGNPIIMEKSKHEFHIPVMGLAYTIDTPLKVARYGIGSVISIVQDHLIEKMRSYYYPLFGKVYKPITAKDLDHRARRITDYLNLVNEVVQQQVAEIRQAPFETGSEIDKYFEMLPEDSVSKQLYNVMMMLPEGNEKKKRQEELRSLITAGSIDANIMTKLDRESIDVNGNKIEDNSDAVAAMRGYAMSTLSNSSIILSAGMNPRLFAYMEKLTAFNADECGSFSKRIVIKVSDYRSAYIQGKMLAKRGLWVSEFRIESGLNCGGHAFATDGYLLGPILEEFKERKSVLREELFQLFSQALRSKGREWTSNPPELQITVQGWIGTHEEHQLLLRHYAVDATGWGSPFLLVPEATTVDDDTRTLLSRAQEEDIILSKNSPLGVRFHYLKGTSSDHEKQSRILRGKPGSPCTEKYLVSNTEFSKEPICTASRSYQRKKLEQLQALGLSPEESDRQSQEILAKECLCVGLSNSAVVTYGTTPLSKSRAVNICPGPNLAYFSEIISLRRMVDHIYGRDSVLTVEHRPHMFIKELSLYLDYWLELVEDSKQVMDQKKKLYVELFHKNMCQGIQYYRELAGSVHTEFGTMREKFLDNLKNIEVRLEDAILQFSPKLASRLE